MNLDGIAHRAALASPLLLALALAAERARADAAAANDCAAKLPKDAKTIFNATLPQIEPGADLRALVTASTRNLATSGTIDQADARKSAVAAAQCLPLASP
jgi:hypothetical protein